MFLKLLLLKQKNVIIVSLLKRKNVVDRSFFSL